MVRWPDQSAVKGKFAPEVGVNMVFARAGRCSDVRALGAGGVVPDNLDEAVSSLFKQTPAQITTPKSSPSRSMHSG